MVFCTAADGIGDNRTFVKVHLRHFGGEKVLMLMEPGEREDAFFVMITGRWFN